MTQHSKSLLPLRRRTLLKGAGGAALAAAALRLQNTEAQENGTPHAMRRAGREPTAPTMPPRPPLAVIALNRMGYGPRYGDIYNFNQLGNTEDERLAAYVEQQLNPAAIDDSDCDARIAAQGFTTLNKTLQQLWTEHFRNDPPYDERVRPIREVTKATYLRGIYSNRQLQEVLADFWHNHFNTYGWDYYASSIFVHYDRDVIRGNMFGNFRQMLEAVGTSSVMLFYLDNHSSSDSGPNENYARELFELHTLGAENYRGVVAPESVPTDENGVPIGYCDNDVYEASRCFTGWRVSDGTGGSPDTGTFYYREEWHDRFQKIVLGFPPNVPPIPANQPPLKDGRDVYDRLASHPGTGRYIARKLVRRFISDTPAESLVQSLAAIFTANVSAPDQLTQVYRALFNSTEFKMAWGEKIKRPFESLISFLRTIGVNYEPGSDNPWWYSASGHIPFNWRAPNGYPDEKEDWSTTMPMLQRWRATNRIMTGVNEVPNITEIILLYTPGTSLSATALADYWIPRVLGRELEFPSHRDEIINFMADGLGANIPIDLTDEDNAERLTHMVGLIALTPDFQYR
jgi:uncharacterized protein (DUF1800 family)